MVQESKGKPAPRAGLSTPASANGGQVNSPQGIDVDQSNGHVYVSGNKGLLVNSRNICPGSALRPGATQPSASAIIVAT